MPYRNPLPSAAARRIRSTVVVGLNRKIVSIRAAAKRAAERLGFLGRHIQRQHAVDARRLRSVTNLVQPHPQDRIGVAEDDDRRRNIARARPAIIASTFASVAPAAIARSVAR